MFSLRGAALNRSQLTDRPGPLRHHVALPNVMQVAVVGWMTPATPRVRAAVTAAVVLLWACAMEYAPPAMAGDRLAATGGVTQIEGSAGGGLVPWSLIAGLGTADQTGGSAFCTDVAPRDYRLDACGVAVGIDNRVELSVARERFGLGSTVPGATISQTIIGAKLRVFGDALIDQDGALPQLAVGVQYKHNGSFDLVPRAVGARHADGVDVYAAATKIWLAGPLGRTWLADLTLRATAANQLGLLGFGGDRGDYHLVPEASVGVFLDDTLVLGGEYRHKANDLSAFHEDDFKDLFLAWWPVPWASLTIAYADLGSIAGKSGQQGSYVSLQLNW